MKGKDLVKLLEKNQWKCDRIAGSHHIMVKDGYRPVPIPVHSTDIGVGLLQKILKQTGLK